MISDLYVNHIYPRQCRQCKKIGENDCLEIVNDECKNYDEDIDHVHHKNIGG